MALTRADAEKFSVGWRTLFRCQCCGRRWRRGRRRRPRRRRERRRRGRSRRREPWRRANQIRVGGGPRVEVAIDREAGWELEDARMLDSVPNVRSERHEADEQDCASDCSQLPASESNPVAFGFKILPATVPAAFRTTRWMAVQRSPTFLVRVRIPFRLLPFAHFRSLRPPGPFEASRSLPARQVDWTTVTGTRLPHPRSWPRVPGHLRQREPEFIVRLDLQFECADVARLARCSEEAGATLVPDPV